MIPNILKNIYDTLPIPMQNILTSLYGYKILNDRYGKYYKSKILELQKRNDKSFDYYSYQLEQLNTFLGYAKANSSYYSSVLGELELPIKSADELKRVSFLTKEDIRKNIDNIVTISTKKAVKSHTGGTTGKSLSIYYSKKDMQDRVAYLDYFKQQHGVHKGMKSASFMGKTIVPINQKKKVFWRYNYPLKQLLFSSFHLTDENISYYIDKLNSFKPHSLDGFSSVMLTIAKYILKNNIKLDFKPLAIFPTAETLLDPDREIIEKAFNSKIRNQYASSEGAPFITECIKGSLHLNIDTGLFEKVEESDVSEIYVTSFSTHGTPLIRYKIGDSLEFTSENCSCGVDTPIVKRILGRSTDFLYSEERGTISSANMSNTVKQLPYSVVGIQFVQTQLKKVEINIVPDKKLFKEEHIQEILKEMKYRLGENMTFHVNLVDRLEISKSGKTRFIINKLDRNTIKY